MLKRSLIDELKYEAENTRRLFDAIPDEVLNYSPNDFNWTIAKLAAHIAGLYDWWDNTLNVDEFDVTTYKYDPGDITNMKAIKEKLDQNIDKAIQLLGDYPEEKLMDLWSMNAKGKQLMPPTPRIQVIRSFLMNHIYHHRGELVSHLRANSLLVPGLYGPTYEQQSQS